MQTPGQQDSRAHVTDSGSTVSADAWHAVGVDVTEGILSGIQDINTDRISPDNTMYNILGIPVGPEYKGVVIKGGKKSYGKMTSRTRSCQLPVNWKSDKSGFGNSGAAFV